MFQFNAEFSDYFTGARDLTWRGHSIPQLLTFDAWLAANKDRIPLA